MQFFLLILAALAGFTHWGLAETEGFGTKAGNIGYGIDIFVWFFIFLFLIYRLGTGKLADDFQRNKGAFIRTFFLITLFFLTLFGAMWN